MVRPKPGQTECLILGNGPSLAGHPWHRMPREKLMIFGVNQSWRVLPDVDAHVAIDFDQYQIPEGKPYYERIVKEGKLFHTGSAGALGFKLDRHDALLFSRHPFRKRHRGAHNPHPGLEHDGGVALKVGHDTGGSSAYVALQIAASVADFAVFWLAGIDMTPTKFTGQKSNSEKHDVLWAHVPPDVKERTRVIGPSRTQQLQIVGWPWGEDQEIAV